MRDPNFFIIGAPKCGTTSVAAWLSAHERIFVTDPKELDYFDVDIAKAWQDSSSRYNSFFNAADERHLAIGEASTGYLRSKVAIPRIMEYYPDARFIVGIRNPIDMAISWHGQCVYEAWETERSFEQAWRLQSRRRLGKDIPSLCREPSNLLYGDVCRLGSQLERLFSQVERTRVFVYSLDDIRDYPRLVYRSILDFLSVPDDGRVAFPVLNQARNVPSWLARTTRLVSDTKRRLGVQAGLGIVNRLNASLEKRERPTISRQMRGELCAFFEPEIQKLARLLGKDLKHWKSYS